MLWLACLGLLLPESVLAAAVQPPRTESGRPMLPSGDAVLGPQGTLQGKVVDPQGRPMGGARVVVAPQRGSAAETVADGEGRFSVSHLGQGTCVVIGGDGASIYRLWAESTAPPSATSDVLIVSDGALVRGQGGMYQWISEHFWLTSALIATAITLPIVLSNDKDDGSP